MSAIPSNIGRAPNLLTSQSLLANLNRSNLALFNIQSQLATGRFVQRPSDDSVRATTIGILDNALERSAQQLKNVSIASSTLGLLDTSLAEINDLAIETRGLITEQVNFSADPETRDSQALVVQSMIDTLYRVANSKSNNLHIFGGSRATRPPIEELLGGYRYVGEGVGLPADLDIGLEALVTIGGNNAIGETAGRHRSTIDLDPGLHPQLLLEDLDGARGQGVSLGPVAFRYNGGPSVQVDLSPAKDIGDVVDLLNGAIAAHEAEIGAPILGPGAVSAGTRGLSVDVLAGPGNPDLVFSDLGLGTTAQDLGIVVPFDPSNEEGVDLNARLTRSTPISAIEALSTGLGSLRVRFTQNGEDYDPYDVDLTGAETIDEIRNRIETVVPGVRVEVNESGTAIDILNEISGVTMSVEALDGSDQTASMLGLRTLTGATKLTQLNHGRGVSIVSGKPDADENVDFALQLAGAGISIDIDLRPEDTADIQSVIDRINAQVSSSAFPGSVEAAIDPATNAIVLRDPLGFGPLSVDVQNNSPAANDLGLVNPDEPLAAGATFVAQDRSGVRVESLFTRLIELRDSLRNNDTLGISLAGESIETDIDRLTSARALVGVQTNRIERAGTRLEEIRLLDQQLKSDAQDLDFAEAAVRFSQVQTQLNATLQAAGQIQSRTLLDFLG